MPSIRVRGFDTVFDTNLTTSILNTLLGNGFPIATLCGGRAQCGRDQIRVVSGAEFLSPMRPREREKLARMAAEGEPGGPDLRLACQCYVRGDVVIEVLNIRRPAAPRDGVVSP
jgi:ferredoxin